MSEAVESMWWKVGVNYDGKPLDKFKADIKNVDDLIKSLGQSSDNKNSAVAQHIKGFKDLENQVKRTVASMMQPPPQVMTGKQIDQQIKAVNDQVAGYKAAGKAMSDFVAQQAKATEQIAQMNERLGNGMRRLPASATRTKGAFNGMFNGFNRGAADAISRLDLMRSNIERLGRIAAGAGIAGGVVGLVANAAGNVVQTTNSSYASGVSPNAQMRFDSQAQQLGANKGDGASLLGNVDKTIADAHYGRIDEGMRTQMSLAGINIDELRNFFDERGNRVTEGTEWLRNKIHRQAQINPGSTRTAAQSFGMSNDMQRAIMMHGASDWQAAGAKFDKSGAAPDDETQAAAEKLNSATRGLSDSMEGLRNKILRIAGPTITKAVETAAEHPAATLVAGAVASTAATGWTFKRIKSLMRGGKTASSGLSAEAMASSGAVAGKVAAKDMARLIPAAGFVMAGVDGAMGAADGEGAKKAYGSDGWQARLSNGLDSAASLGFESVKDIVTKWHNAGDRWLYEHLTDFTVNDQNQVISKNAIPGSPHDAYYDLSWKEQIKLDERERRRASLLARGQSLDEFGLGGQDLINDAEIMRQHRERLAWEQVQQNRPATPASTSPAGHMLTGSKKEQLDLINRQVEFKESRGRDYNADGSVYTSPAGARGRMQVMPSTARKPGYGVTAARDGSIAESNRVGIDILEKMYDRYGGDPDKVLASYNAGPGRLDAIIGKHKDRWRDYLPPETKGYIDYDSHAPNFGGGPMNGEQPKQITNNITINATGNYSPEELAQAARTEAEKMYARENDAAMTIFVNTTPDV